MKLKTFKKKSNQKAWERIWKNKKTEEEWWWLFLKCDLSTPTAASFWCFFVFSFPSE